MPVYRTGVVDDRCPPGVIIRLFQPLEGATLRQYEVGVIRIWATQEELVPASIRWSGVWEGEAPVQSNFFTRAIGDRCAFT